MKVVQKIQKARNIPLSPFVLAALPSGADLSHLLGLAWNSDRTVPQTLGVIHPLGVTYYLPTRALLTADVGPPFIDIGDPSIQKKIAGSDVVAIQTILEIMSDQNRILTFTDTAGPLAFEMKYFSLADLPRVTQWLDEHVAYLTKDEETERVLLRGRDSR